MLKENVLKKFSPLIKKVWLSSPTMHGEELKYMQEAYETNWMSTVGENINAVEQLLCEKIGCKYAVALASGTAALHMAVKLAGVQNGDKVFCSDMTFAATVNPVVYEGGVPVFIDAEYATWNIDPAALSKAFELYPGVKVVVLAHLYGSPGKMDELKAVCDKHGAMFLTDDATAADKVRKWSTQARENVPWYQHEELGYNYRMSNVIAGVVRGQLPYLEEHISQKKAIYMRYKKGFKNLPVKMNPFDVVNSQPNYWLSCLLIDSEAMCKQVCSEKETFYLSEKGKTCPTEILEALAAMNAEGRPIWKPMHMQPLYRMNAFVTRAGSDRAKATYCINGAEAVPNGNPADVAMDIFERGVCLPSDIKMTTQEQDRIIEIIKSCFE